MPTACCFESRAQLGQSIDGDLEADRLRVAAEAHHLGLELGQELVEVDAADAAPGADAGRAVDRDQDRRPVELARDARSGDADDAAMPALAPLDDDRRQLAAIDHAPSRLLDHGLLLGLALAVALVELGGERRRALRIAREQQLERLVGAVQPARGVESRPEPVSRRRWRETAAPRRRRESSARSPSERV